MLIVPVFVHYFTLCYGMFFGNNLVNKHKNTWYQAFRRYADDISSFLGYYASYSANSKSKKKGFFDFLTLEDGTDRLSPNIGSELQLYTA